tara:strand:+ start:772 stop:1074 length:303 start_codon:yes stop_codon:yes gene_type:complete
MASKHEDIVTGVVIGVVIVIVIGVVIGVIIVIVIVIGVVILPTEIKRRHGWIYKNKGVIKGSESACFNVIINPSKVSILFVQGLEDGTNLYSIEIFYCGV